MSYFVKLLILICICRVISTATDFQIDSFVCKSFNKSVFNAECEITDNTRVTLAFDYIELQNKTMVKKTKWQAFCSIWTFRSSSSFSKWRMESFKMFWNRISLIGACCQLVKRSSTFSSRLLWKALKKLRLTSCIRVPIKVCIKWKTFHSPDSSSQSTRMEITSWSSHCLMQPSDCSRLKTSTHLNKNYNCH